MHQAQKQTFSCLSLLVYISHLILVPQPKRKVTLLNKRFDEPHDNFAKLTAYTYSFNTC